MPILWKVIWLLLELGIGTKVSFCVCSFKFILQFYSCPHFNATPEDQRRDREEGEVSLSLFLLLFIILFIISALSNLCCMKFNQFIFLPLFNTVSPFYGPCCPGSPSSVTTIFHGYLLLPSAGATIVQGYHHPWPPPSVVVILYCWRRCFPY